MTDKAWGRMPRMWLWLLVSAFVYVAWDGATWLWYVTMARWSTIPQYLYRVQDMPALIGIAIGLIALMPLSGPGKGRTGGAGERQGPSNWAIALACLAAVIVARIGRELVFHGYSPSRDEVMVELAGAYLADGHIGWPVPNEWLLYARPMLPEFFSPYGAATVWTSIYLPVHAAIRALFLRLGDGDLASPVMLGIGLLALWNIACRLFPTRADVRTVVMVMALTSTQLVVTAMTPYAMTSHFALDMLWLALILRGGLAANLIAAVVLMLAMGLHQWHFPILFAGPIILWQYWRRSWRDASIQTGAILGGILLWAKLWPLFLAHVLGPPAKASAGGAPGVGEKIASLFGRLERWQPLLNLARLVAWNNILLLPLTALSTLYLPRSLRAVIREQSIVVPLLGIVLIGCATAMYQGYGWGFRYMHGQIGVLCLLAGYGWSVLSPDGRRSMRLIWAAAAISLLVSAWQLVTTEKHVRGYARTMAAIRASKADVVLVDLRGGYFMNDLVRFRDGVPGKPMVMSMGMLNTDEMTELCAHHSVAVIDHSQFWPLGVHRIRPKVRESDWLDSRRALLDRLHCDTPVIPAPVSPPLVPKPE